MKNKLIIGGFIILAVALGIVVFLYLLEKSAREDAENKFAEEKKVALREQADSLNLEFVVKSLEFENKIIELSTREQEIKYIPYEKLRYIDRNVDAALDTIANYRFNQRAEN